MIMNPVSSNPAKKAGAASLFTTREMVLAGMFAAVMAVISQLSIPMPTGVPVTIQVFGVALVGAVLGWRLGLCSMLVYILIGAVGLPVFANFGGGIKSLVGLTGGYIWAWPIMAALCGIQPGLKSKKADLGARILLALVGLAAVEIIGGLQWAALSGDMTLGAVFAYSLVAFIPKDIVITVIAVVISGPFRKMIARGI
ncbi:biotin transporter BioY [Enterocloster sp.]|jgi:biotin transport system substrate-specific component